MSKGLSSSPVSPIQTVNFGRKSREINAVLITPQLIPLPCGTCGAQEAFPLRQVCHNSAPAQPPPPPPSLPVVCPINASSSDGHEALLLLVLGGMGLAAGPLRDVSCLWSCRLHQISVEAVASPAAPVSDWRPTHTPIGPAGGRARRPLAVPLSSCKSDDLLEIFFFQKVSKNFSKKNVGRVVTDCPLCCRSKTYL